MKERAFIFGANKNLVGILTEPAARVALPDEPIMLLVNAGMLHKVGPNRMHVELARHLSEVGYSVFRFDLSGIGDSEARAEMVTPEEGAVRDAQEAMNFLAAKRGVNKFIVTGLCSGAEDSMSISGRDPRVVGTVLMDPGAYRTPRYYLKFYFDRLTNPRLIKSWLGRRVRHYIRHRRGEARSSAVPEQDLRQLRAKADASAEIQALLERKQHLLFIFTGGMPECYSYSGQLYDIFPFLKSHELVEEHYLPHADHMFQWAEERLRVVLLIKKWMTDHYPITTG